MHHVSLQYSRALPVPQHESQLRKQLSVYDRNKVLAMVLRGVRHAMSLKELV
jgi:hypothetical protein